MKITTEIKQKTQYLKKQKKKKQTEMIAGRDLVTKMFVREKCF